MSKERLEEIAYNVGVSLDGEKAIMSSDDYDFLYNYALEQAERAQELERELEEHKSKFTVKYTMSLREQNKRYREALEEIKELTRFDDGSKEKEYEIACKALEESGAVLYEGRN